jgi:hypothetical protein
VHAALRDEVERGHIGHAGGRYWLVPSAFDQGTLAALQAL